MILQNHIDDVESERYALEFAKKLELPTLIRADLAFYLLKEDQTVTLNPPHALVYNGIIEP